MALFIILGVITALAPNNSRQVSKWINKDAIRKNCPCLIALREPGKVFCDSGQF
jgi:hypothetical protein